jgi:predicted DNA-binding ArsR family transcriptional regulator
MGFIAQQIKPFVPEIVNGTEEGGYRVSYQNITALLVEAIKDLNNKIEVIALQEQAIEYLNSKLEELQKRG